MIPNGGVIDRYIKYHEGEIGFAWAGILVVYVNAIRKMFESDGENVGRPMKIAVEKTGALGPAQDKISACNSELEAQKVVAKKKAEDIDAQKQALKDHTAARRREGIGCNGAWDHGQGRRRAGFP